MMSVTELFVVNCNGEVLLKRSYGTDVQPHRPSMAFVEEMKRSKSLPPAWDTMGQTVYHIQKGKLLWCCTSSSKSCSFVITELLQQFYELVADFCDHTVTEEAFISNHLLLNELLGEFIDNGVVQLSVSDRIRPHIFTERGTYDVRSPLQKQAAGMFGQVLRPLPAYASNKSLNKTSDTEAGRIYVDVLERVTTSVASTGALNSCLLTGEIITKCHMSTSSEIRLQLKNNIAYTEKSQILRDVHGAKMINDWQLHSGVKRLNNTGTLLGFSPVAGKCTLLRYTLPVGTYTSLPFVLNLNVEPHSKDLDITMSLSFNSSTHTVAEKISVMLTIPAGTTHLGQKLFGPQKKSKIYLNKELGQITWHIKELPVHTECKAICKLINGNSKSAAANEIGPAILNFEIPSTMSGVEVESVIMGDLGYSDKKAYSKWVRHVTLGENCQYEFRKKML